MYMYMYIRTCIYMYTNIHVHVYTCMFGDVHVHVCIGIHVYTCTYMYMYVWDVHCIYICTVHVHVHVYVEVHVHVCSLALSSSLHQLLRDYTCTCTFRKFQEVRYSYKHSPIHSIGLVVFQWQQVCVVSCMCIVNTTNLDRHHRERQTIGDLMEAVTAAARLLYLPQPGCQGREIWQ